MKKSELVKLIQETITESKIVLKEENELLKTQDACKSTMFKIKKAVDVVYESWKKKGILDSFKTTVSPWNNGYELKFKYKENKDLFKDKEGYKKYEKILKVIYGNNNIFIQPGSFYQSYIDEGKTAYIEGNVLALSKYNSFRKDIKVKADIVPALKDYLDKNMDIIAEFKQL